MGHPDDDATEVLPASAEPVVPVTRPTDPAALIGRTLGKFSVVERLGRGGSGEVFRAEQTQLGRSAVIKVLRREVAAVPNRVERFLREAKLASRLDHPYAAHVYAFGAEPDGVLWIAMEYVRGITLDELVASRGPMPPSVFGALFARLCEVVHTAHELGIVHRDIKGSNVMVIERAGQLLPKLLDFGIAKGIDGGPSPSTNADDVALTGQGSTLGSPHYMAPEQWESPGSVDARADIYALGVLAYRCISGNLPFEGIERPALAGAHLTMPPPPLPEMVPVSIAEAIMRALAKLPDARWPSALVFGEGMRRGDAGGALETVPIFDAATRDTWSRSGPQPIADAIARLSRAATTVEADAALRELIAITCRWLAVLALAQLHPEASHADVRKAAHAVVGRDDAGPWLRLARVAAATAPALPGLDAALAQTKVLEMLADRLDDRDRARTAAALAADIAAVPEALQPIETLLDYHLVVGRAGGAESWQGPRRRDRERLVVWGDPLADGEVALLDGTRRVVTRLSPLVQVVSPLPSAEPELFLLWRSGRGAARLVAAPWGFERDDEAAAQRLAVLTTEDSDTLADAAGDKSPYPGLAPYGVDDADRFVGREREVEALANRMIRAPMAAVLGPSGAGKSSFIHAGLLPRLAENYEIITMRPGRHPLHALAALPPINTSLDGGTDEATLIERLRALGDRAPRGLVIVIDQLEELVTLCGDPDERRRFSEVLAKVADTRSAPVRVVVTLRDDFASVLESEDAFRGRFEVFVLSTPPPDALRRIVTEPARRAQVTVDPKVVDDMVTEVAGRAASLPLLSFTASQLWQTRDRQKRQITYESYLAIGGVAGALSTYADDVYGSLARRDQDVVRDLFSRLVAGDGTRIPAPRAELEQIRGAPAVLAHLIDARLLVVREDDDIVFVEIVHECLATRWDRLARWRSEDAADRALLGDVGAAARRWQEAGRRPDLLWRGEAVRELRKLAARSTAMTDVERAFADDADRAARRSRRIRRTAVVLVMAALGAVALVMAYLSIEANHSRGAAERSAGEARTAASLAEDRLTTSLVAQGRRELNDGRALAALAYFADALRRGADSPGLRFMIGIAARAWRDEKLVLHGKGIKSVASSPTAFAAGDREGRIYWWGYDGKPLGELATEVGEIIELRWRGERMLAAGYKGIAVIDPAKRQVVGNVQLKDYVGDVHFGPGDDELVAVRTNAIEIYGLDGKLRRSGKVDLTQSDGHPVFSDRGLAFVAIAMTVQVFDLRTMELRMIAKESMSPPNGSADGSTIVYLGRDGVAHVLRGDATEVRSFKPSNPAVHLAISATGDRIGAVSDHTITIYETATGKQLRTLTLEADELIIRLRGDDIYTGTVHGTVRHYHEDALVATMPSHVSELEEIRIAGDLLLTIGNDYTFVVLRADARQLLMDPEPCKQGSFTLTGPAVAYVCDESEHVYIGRRKIGVVHDRGVAWGTIDPVSNRGAAVLQKSMVVFEADGTQLATTTEHSGILQFEDRDHLIVIDDGTNDPAKAGLWRWTVSTQHWERIRDVDKEPTSIVLTPSGILYGTEQRQVIFVRGGREVRRTDLGERVDSLSASADHRLVAAQLGGGGTVILDAEGQVVRRFEPADTVGVVSVLDPKGDLVIRTSRGTLTVWDVASGDSLLYKFEILKTAAIARFALDGRIEVVGDHLGVLDIHRDNRPVSEILRDIECRVPLEVAGSRLEARTVDCDKGSR